MSPAGLSGVLALYLGAGAADIAVLNLTVLPRLRVTVPAVTASAVPARSVPKITSQTELASALSTERTAPPAPAAELVAILEFEPGSHRVGRRATAMLNETLKRLRAASEIAVVGHADASGPEELNERLSGERAQSVAEKLTNAGIPTRHIRLEACGEREPRLHGNSRRVEIYVGVQP